MRTRVTAACRQARGITLIECVIALAIVAALMSIALPSFGDAMARARLRAAAETSPWTSATLDWRAFAKALGSCT
jgi:prepilin-type N-terminal cleavage/methylation domain-containing protein